MKYVGIDLGTTNSAICTFDGDEVRLFKSPEQHDVTPSVIFIDKRSRYVGFRAYQNSARYPENSAMLFKRLMGTRTPVHLPKIDLTLSPEECSAEVLRTLFGYLPEEIRLKGDLGTVITVPAAFNQMQKDSTLVAAHKAGIGSVALMQEPVAAVMSVMRKRATDGIFVVFDLGGGTLDIAIAESISGRVSLLSHGGIAMCGGRDFDRSLFDNLVKPWLHENFDLPDNLSTAPEYRSMLRMCNYAVEKAKIELSGRDETIISASEVELGMKDLSGEDIYIDIPVTRGDYDKLISPKIEEAIQNLRETLQSSGLASSDIQRIVFVGGPTHYKPLRDRVSFEIGIEASTEVNPMTAVAEGAAIFAESIDWGSENRSRKGSTSGIKSSGQFDISFNFISRTPDAKSKVVAKVVPPDHSGLEYQIDSMNTGWSSGRMALVNGTGIELQLPKLGSNDFKVFVFDQAGSPVKLSEDIISISRVTASVDSIPASHSIGIEAREKLGGQHTLEFLVRKGDQLPFKGKKIFKSEESLKAGTPNSIKFKLWEGDILNPVSDNRFVGLFEIRGSDFDDGVITAGAELVCDYEILDSGNIVIDVTVPSIGASFNSGRNFYSSQEGQIDFTQSAEYIDEEIENAEEKLSRLQNVATDNRLEKAREKLDAAKALDKSGSDPESAKQAADNVQEAKRLIAQSKKDNAREVAQTELDDAINHYRSNVEKYARPTEAKSIESLIQTLQRDIENNTSDFDSHLSEFYSKCFGILWREDWYVIDYFNRFTRLRGTFTNEAEFDRLVVAGKTAIKLNDINKLRAIIGELYSYKISTSSEEDVLVTSNIVRG